MSKRLLDTGGSMLSPNGKQKAARVFNTRNHTSSVVDFQNGLICSPPTKEMVQKILVQYSNEPDGPELDDPTVESMSQLVHQWSPNLHVVCMYARWSKKIRCNYHLDTINTLLCVAEHTKYSPYELLSKVVSIQIAQSRKVFGLSFLFHFLNIVDIDKEQLKLQFTSLAVTLRVLETSVVSSISGSPGKQKNSSRLPTVKTIETRMWTSLEHRWLSFKMVEVLFEEWLLKQKDEQVALHFSFRIHEAAGLSRFDFLNPLVGICFRYRNIEIILNLKDELKNVWETPSSFVSYGNSLLAHTTDRVKLLVDSFTEARSLVQFYRVTFTRKRTRIDKWIMLRAYVFQLWLERKQNEDLKKEVDTLLNQHTLETRMKPQTLLPALTVEAHSKTNDSIAPVTTKRPSSDRSHNGLLQLLQSRKKTVPLSVEYSIDAPSRRNAPPNAPIICQAHEKKAIDINSIEWTSWQLASRSELSRCASSFLVIKRDDGIKVLAELSPLEVYSANHLWKLLHSRINRPPNYSPFEEFGPVVLSINNRIDKFLDPARYYHVVREDSTNFQEHGNLLPSLEDMRILCQAVCCHGQSGDTTRCPSQFRVNIGCGGQHRPTGRPETLIGLGFRSAVDKDVRFKEKNVLKTIGSICHFIWNILQDMQHQTGDSPMAPHANRYNEYAKHLSAYLGIEDGIVGFEDVTISVGLLYPIQDDVIEHPDTMNDSMCGYTRTGVFNAVFMSSIVGNNQEVLVHFQILCNFRKVIREYLFPRYSTFSQIEANVRGYLFKWSQNMEAVFGSATASIPLPFDRTNFFLDDVLPYQSIEISRRQGSQCISGEYLLTTINPSRVLSFSMMIDSLVLAKEVLCFDQLIELSFGASMLNNPFWFDYTMRQLFQRHKSSQDDFRFGTHPFHDWIKETERIFGAWQGGPYNRWSPCGGSTQLPVLFGAHSTATEDQIRIGTKRLENIVGVLHRYLLWVNSLTNTVQDPTLDLPLTTVEYCMKEVTREVFNVVPCQFSSFRLTVFTTLVIGTGVLRSGLHLKSLVFPVKGLGSAKHLDIACMEESNESGNKSSFEIHDRMMLTLSVSLQQPHFLRDEMECVLCESHPDRNEACRDWFRKGQRIFDCDKNGKVYQKNYGQYNKWEPIESPAFYQYAFLRLFVFYCREDDEIFDYATEFGSVLRNNRSSIRYQGRPSKTSNGTYHYQNSYMNEKRWGQMSVLRHRIAHFFRVKGNPHLLQHRKMLVLGDGEHPKHVPSECNDLDNYEYGNMLHKRVVEMVHGSATTTQMLDGACYHHHSVNEFDQEDNEILYYPGHVDKSFVDKACFVPLTDREFYTLVAVPDAWNIEQNKESKEFYNQWIETQDGATKQSIQRFYEDFIHTARKKMKKDIKVLVYYCKVGSVLAFPANICFHATVTPKPIVKEANKHPRDLIIFHPLVFDTDTKQK